MCEPLYKAAHDRRTPVQFRGSKKKEEREKGKRRRVRKQQQEVIQRRGVLFLKTPPSGSSRVRVGKKAGRLGRRVWRSRQGLGDLRASTSTQEDWEGAIAGRSYRGLGDLGASWTCRIFDNDTGNSKCGGRAATTASGNVHAAHVGPSSRIEDLCR